MDISSSSFLINKSKLNTNILSFKHHPYFDACKEIRPDPTVSNYFRRGPFYGKGEVYTTKDFIHIVMTLKDLLQKLKPSSCKESSAYIKPDDKFADFKQGLLPIGINKLSYWSKLNKFSENTIVGCSASNKQTVKPKKIQMLIGGIGKSQEPFSILAVIKSLIRKNKNVGEILDMHVVDLQSKPNSSVLKQQSYCDSYPAYAESSFEFDGHGYKVHDDIFDFVSRTYNNSEVAKWETPIQEAAEEYSDNSFDLIVLNNTLCYITDNNVRIKTLKNILRILKPGGIFITDASPYSGPYTQIHSVFLPLVAKEIRPGIYQKNVVADSVNLIRNLIQRPSNKF